MRRARTIIGLPVISLGDGLRVGKVCDIVFNPEARSIAALVLREGSWHRDAELIPIDNVRSFGRDAVTIHNGHGVVKARSNRELYRLYASGIKFDGLLVMTEAGNYLGQVEEVILGDHAEMLAYEVSAGFAEDVNRGKIMLPANEAITVGRDVATFPDGIESLVTRQLAEVEPSYDGVPADVHLLHPLTQSSA